MDQLSLTAMFGETPDWVESADLSMGVSGGRKLAAVAHRAARTVVETLDAKREQIAADRDLTDEGKAKRLARAVRDAEVEVRRVGEHRDKLATEMAQAIEGARPRVRRFENPPCIIL